VTKICTSFSEPRDSKPTVGLWSAETILGRDRGRELQEFASPLLFEALVWSKPSSARREEEKMN